MTRSTERGMGMAENKGSSKVDDYDDDEELTSTELTGFRDKLKDEAIVTIDALHKAGTEVYLITGDNKLCAAAVAKDAGIPESHVRAEVTPAGKKAEVSRLQRANHTVCNAVECVLSLTPTLALLLAATLSAFPWRPASSSPSGTSSSLPRPQASAWL